MAKATRTEDFGSGDARGAGASGNTAGAEGPFLFESIITRAATERSSVGVALLMCVASLLVFPFVDIEGPVVPGLTAFFAGIVLMGHGTTAWLALALARSDCSPAVLLLAMGYLASALLAVPYLLTFPGALARGGPLFGTGVSAAWLFIGLNIATALPALAGALLALGGVCHRGSRAGFDRLLAAAILITLGISVATSVLAIQADSWLPPLLLGTRFTPLYQQLATAVFLLHLSTAAMMLALRGRIPVFAWAAVAHVAAALAHLSASAGGGRFTIGWTYGRISYTLAALFVLFFFLWLFARQQRRLGRANILLEERVGQRTSELAAMVGERDLLLREVYHRVRNNLAIVDGLAHLQLRSVSSSDGRSAIADMRQRVQALALLHEQLIQPLGPGREPCMDLKPYLEALCQAIAAASATDARAIRIETDIAPSPISPETAAPLGMIVSELVTNAIRHAFGTQGGVIRITAAPVEEGGFLVAITDNGTSGQLKQLGSAPGLGGQIVAALTRQLRGSLSMDLSDTGGAEVRLRVP